MVKGLQAMLGWNRGGENESGDPERFASDPISFYIGSELNSSSIKFS